jgi:deazaflavin-dependent oxidoreductase (nitroreductase family)
VTPIDGAGAAAPHAYHGIEPARAGDRFEVDMSSPDPRAAYAAMTEALIREFRASGGQVTQGPFAGRPIMLLTTTGAKSGVDRVAPVVYTRDGDRILIVASKGGAPTNPSWFANLTANPIVTVELGPDRFRARATVPHGTERDRLFAICAGTHPGFLDYEKRTTRVIPVVVLERLP